MSENGGVQNASFVKVSFPTPDGPFGSEGIWCEPVLGDVYAVGNIPFFVYLRRRECSIVHDGGESPGVDVL